MTAPHPATIAAGMNGMGKGGTLRTAESHARNAVNRYTPIITARQDAGITDAGNVIGKVIFPTPHYQHMAQQLLVGRQPEDSHNHPPRRKQRKQ